jgi:Na+-translocating ferredoxin:NAD+ oxidoreductase RnfD subunit
VTLDRFLRTPKGLLLVVLLALALVAASTEGWTRPLAELAVAAGAAGVLDAVILRVRKGKWVLPSGALLSGLIVGMILSPSERLGVVAVTSAIAVVSKYPLRVRTANVFNPAALAIALSFHLFATAQDWWGALPDAPPAALALLVAGGAWVAWKVNKLPGVLVFLGCHFLLFTATSFVADPASVAELFRTPDLQATMFFAFFMVTDPPTSPPRPRDQVIFSALTALASWATFELAGVAYYLLAGVLVANVWEAWRRWRSTARKSVRREAALAT